MNQTNSIEKGYVMLLVGTRKEAFIVSSDESWKDWSVAAPYFDTNDTFHVVYVGRNGGTLLAAANDTFFGSQIKVNHDLGRTWSESEQTPKISDGSDLTFSRGWHLEPGVVYLSAQPVSLFRNHD